MKISDSPYAVGTPEHSTWVNYVFIPAVSDERFETDAALYGAESIGGERIQGGGYWDDVWRPERPATPLYGADWAVDFPAHIAQYASNVIEPLMGSFVRVGGAFRAAANSFTVFLEAFENTVCSWSDPAWLQPALRVGNRLDWNTETRITEWARSGVIAGNPEFGGRPALPFLVEPEAPAAIECVGLPAKPDFQKLIERGRRSAAPARSPRRR